MAKKKGAPKTTATRGTSRAQTSTDLERHVNAPGRKQLVKQVREKIKELGISYIYFQFISVTSSRSN